MLDALIAQQRELLLLVRAERVPEIVAVVVGGVVFAPNVDAVVDLFAVHHC